MRILWDKPVAMMGNQLSASYRRSLSTKLITKFFYTNKEVADALATNKPVVALESTIITHGMPYPDNIQVAKEVEEIVRMEKAVPATIALVNGRIKVGLQAEDWQVLGSTAPKNLFKISRRDLGYAISRNLSGGTTVSGTMTIAHKAGIRIFATGGIGGVHRGVEDTHDVSADLIELSRTPVMVFSSGIKSILDIPRTLEYLETLGVLVGVYRGDNGQFPAFYTRTSGQDALYNFESVKEIVELLKANQILGEQAGVLIGVPIPKESELNKLEIEAAIEQALQTAKELEIKGKAVTPFLLGAVLKATKGKSLIANKALIKNNAKVAARVAAAFALDGESTSTVTKKTPTGIPTVIGGAIVDTCFRIVDDAPLELNGATYKSERRISAGGVGRNIAEGIQKLHGKVNFLSAVGNDSSGQLIRDSLNGASLYFNTTPVDRGTCNCSVVFDQAGDCKLVVGSDMDIFNHITPEFVQQHEAVLSASPIVVFDANLNIVVMEALLELCRRHNIPAFFEPTDMLIAAKPYKEISELATKQIKFISPNLAELLAIGRVLCPEQTQNQKMLPQTTEDILEVVKGIGPALLGSTCDNILVTLGDKGVLLLTNRDPDEAFYSQGRRTGQLVYTDNNRGPRGLFYAMEDNGGELLAEDIVNVSGAGDSFTSGFIAGMLQGWTANECVWKGMNSACCALKSQSAVPNSYNLTDGARAAKSRILF